jgi:hypothetical protein
MYGEFTISNTKCASVDYLRKKRIFVTGCSLFVYGSIIFVLVFLFSWHMAAAAVCMEVRKYTRQGVDLTENAVHIYGGQVIRSVTQLSIYITKS